LKLTEFQGLFHPGVMMQMGGAECVVASVKNTLTMLSHDIRVGHGNTLIGEERLALELMEHTRDELVKALEAIQPKLDEYYQLYPPIEPVTEDSDNVKIEVSGEGAGLSQTKLIYPGGE
jgi:hypothetical protein